MDDLQVARNGLLHRRVFLNSSAALAAAFTGYTLTDTVAAQQLAEAPWFKTKGKVIPPYETPSQHEKAVVRALTNPNNEGRNSHARTPHHLINGTFTPNGLHMIVLHTGVPDIDPAQHRLVVHGLVRQPLVFTLDSLGRYPMTSRMAFMECGGNSAALFSNEPVQGTVQLLHGLVSCAEWTGVMLSTLLDEAGVDPRAQWVVAEGGDAGAMNRSIPLSKALDDVMVALYQNGERLMPSNGYPMRLVVPGWEGNMNVKWVRRLELTDAPAMTYNEARTYTQVLPGGKSYQFYFLQEVRSFITHPSPGLKLNGPGLYEVSGIAYSGTGRIAKVMVSADGGHTWAQAALQEPVLPKAFTRFRIPWRWNGSSAVLQSRAWDEAGNVQPTRAQFVATRGQTKEPPNPLGWPSQHFNAIVSWGVDAAGEVRHVYA